jgi:hypothetical protein
MGLLDDAIREHLELKRRRGADPGEVAREQREALDPVPRRESTATDGEVVLDGQPTSAEPVASTPGAEEEAEQAQIDPAAAQDVADVPDVVDIGETVELDMQSVLGEGEHDTGGDPPVEDDRSADPPAAGPLPEQDSLEWEVPGDGAGEQAAQSGEGDESSEVGSADDVLEETPDFLRDTPEQERLWFEQRPPRDFDFDK